MRSIVTNKRTQLSPSRLVSRALLGASVALCACVSDDNMCGDDMELVQDPMYGNIKMCMPKVAPDTDTDTDTGIEQPSDTGPVLDAGGDAADSGGDTGQTPACSSGSDCGAGEYCDLDLSPPTCIPATGEGMACTSDADCAGFEADYCEAYVSGTCLIQNCSPELNNCSAEYLCCDFSWMGLPALCVNSEMSGGVCYEP